jgi:6-phosphofructokinase 1
LPEKAFVVSRKNNRTLKDIAISSKLLKAGARKELYFNPKETEAMILTCGGLCPGLNVVIREITMSLWYNYEVKHIYGIKWGYKGIYTDVKNNWIELTPGIVSGIHKKGGTILGSSRGGFDADKILNAIIEKNNQNFKNGIKRRISMVFIIGGDGTHRGIYHLTECARKKGLDISFAGIPKTIDNDIPLIDSSFGFETSCAVAA